MPAPRKPAPEQPSNEGKTPLTAFRLDDHHRALLEACAQAEFSTKVEVIKRAIRAYADQLGVTSNPQPKRKPKTK